MFIKKLEISSNPAAILFEFSKILEKATWGLKNQVGLKCRPGATDPWFDAVGSLYNQKSNTKIASESDFSEWILEDDSYIRQQISLLEASDNFKCGRVRIMRLLPHQGLSVHKDEEVRYHLVLKTNPKAYIAHRVVDNNPERSDVPTTAVCYHLPMNLKWYKVDTREVHWVYNGGDTERIHLVVCGES